ncbi:hypothetical protein L861_16925 [Litchfieldella anticariensis FP35 = DSM 16096]|uniref:Uncharacterized protein n=1 Tax=Litchfieldella anticariensis (strain DSM 16096 / CECT 5854 / CIP 108499 / LMG 22089 / FP35) TaxID=1121939 RepID=S2KHV2_LITA3|nr:hypothetical protein L861_16925 [Halomonas anticariensis FP35 = DSM 16096]
MVSHRGLLLGLSVIADFQASTEGEGGKLEFATTS